MVKVVKKIAKKNIDAAEKKNSGKAWVVSVNMGYGHQRTAHPLRGLAYKGQIINANDYSGIPDKDKKIWHDSCRFYEAISKFKRIPLAGGAAFSLYDNLFQKIIEFYPRKDLSRSPFLTNSTYGLIKNGWGRDFVKKLEAKPMPLVTTFFIPAFMAEEHDYSQEIYLIVCDADISRQWAARDPINSHINYCVPNLRTAARLNLYGVPKKRIFLTGYPLPEINIASAKKDIFQMDLVKADLGRRLANLDPAGAYTAQYAGLIDETLGRGAKRSWGLAAKGGQFRQRDVTIMFSVGGAGAQSEIGLNIMRQLGARIKAENMKVVLSVGINQKLKKLYQDEAKKLNMDKCPGLEILFEPKIADYFDRFNKALRKTDILWTKPSELSFYSALGVPIIVAPPVGSQEDFNKSWLLKSGFGVEQDDLRCIGQWLDDWLDNGYLAEAAMEGFIEGEKMGTRNIKRLVLDK